MLLSVIPGRPAREMLWFGFIMPLCLAQRYADLPLAFEPNQGQMPRPVLFSTRAGGHQIALNSRDITVTATGSRPVRIQFSGARKPRAVRGLAPAGRTSYFNGNDPRGWHTGIINYARVRYERIYPGIDLEFHGKQAEFEFDFIVAAGADPSRIGMEFEGARSLRIGTGGALYVEGRDFSLEQRKPLLYQERNGTRIEVAGEYVIREGKHVGFRVGPYDRSRALVIDPVLTYSACIGSMTPQAVAVDNSGDVYLTGYADSNSDAITGPGLQTGALGMNWVFISKLNATATAVVYTAFLGGDPGSASTGRGIAVDADGNAYVTGHTDSQNFSTTAGAFQSTGALSGGWRTQHGFVAKLNPTGDGLIYCTYVGANYMDLPSAIAVDASGNAYITGTTYSTTFPLKNAFQSATGSGHDAFVTKLNSTGTGILYSSYLGGSADDEGTAIAAGPGGTAYVTGWTLSMDFPVSAGSLSGANPNARAYLHPGFVAKIRADGSGLVYSTYLDGSLVFPAGIAVNTNGEAHIAGTALSLLLPNVVLAGPGNTSDTDSFAVKLNAAGSAPLYAIKIGGSSDDGATGIALDANGNAWVSGYSASRDFPLVSPAQALPGAVGGVTSNAVALQLDANGSLVYSTFLGGNDKSIGVAVAPTGTAYVAGSSPNAFPVPTTPGAMSRLSGVFVAAFSAGQTCTFALTSNASAGFAKQGGTGSVGVQAPDGCSWIGMSNQQWIAISRPGSGSGTGTLNYTVSPNISPARTAMVSVAGELFQVSQQDGCTYSISSSSANVGGAGAGVRVQLNSGPYCPWSVGGLPEWISTGSLSGVSAQEILFSIAAGGPRSAVIGIAGIPFTITQGNPPPVQFLGQDRLTQGTWKQVYGGDGYNVINNAVSYPDYVTPVASANTSFTWAADTTDQRALQQPASDFQRVAAVWYSPGQFTVDLPFMDTGVHPLAVYCLDWDSAGRSETLEILDANGSVMDGQTISYFEAGVWVVWNVKGHVQLRVTRVAGPNAVISGVFLGPGKPLPVMVGVTPASAILHGGQQQQFTATLANATTLGLDWTLAPNTGSIGGTGLYTAPATILSPQTVTVTAASKQDGSRKASAVISLLPLAASPGSAQFLKLDSSTAGSWKSSYGSAGFYLAGSGPGFPSFVTPSLSGAAAYVWSANTEDPRALQQPPPGAQRVAGTWYAKDQFTADLAVSDGQVHQLAVYCLDYDRLGRAETLEILDESNAVLDTRALTGFGNGVWVVWNVGGHVRLRVTRTAGPNAVVSGLFFGPSGTAPVTVSISPLQVTLAANQTQQFTAAVANSANTAVTWSVSPAIGTMSDTGLYTAPTTGAGQQGVIVTATSQADATAKASAAVTLSSPGLPPVNTAQFLRQDAATQGSWKGVYGADGYNVVNDRAIYPAYASPAAGGAASYTWAPVTTDVRALQSAGTTAQRIAGGWYAADQFSVAFQFGDTQPHQVAVYFLDWDNLGRSQRVDIVDVSGNVLDSRQSSNFSNGVWLVWTLSGNVSLHIVNTGGVNAVLSGLFFGAGTAPVTVSISPATAALSANMTQQFTATVTNPANRAVTWSLSPNIGTIGNDGTYTAPATITGLQNVTLTAASQADPSKQASAAIILIGQPAAGAGTAQFVKQDWATQGSWQGVYGTDGYDAIANAVSYPPYASVLPSGAGGAVWASSTADIRALVHPSSTDRVAGVWYAADRFVVDLPVSAAQPYQLAVYCLDWDNLGRIEVLEILDGNNTVLDAHTVSQFRTGLWMVWNVNGHVQLRVTRTAGLNAVISGIFFGAAGAPGASAQFAKFDSTTQGAWRGVYGAEGYNVIGTSPSYPAYAIPVTVTGNSAYVWAAATSDVRGLQQPAASGSRVAGVWYSAGQFALDLPLSDSRPHRLAVYCLDWDNLGRIQKLEILDASGAVLDSRTIGQFSGGVWVIWTVQGHVQLRVSRVAGVNAVVSGLLFDAAP